jgi:hypothetical protein
MGIRLPLQTVATISDTGNVGATSVAGGSGFNFFLPQDSDNAVVKFTASISGGGVSATWQTTDDGGTTWYDVARTSVVSNANATTAQWLSVPTISPGISPIPTSSVLFTGSVMSFSQTIGSAAASTLGSRQVSGMPILGSLNRIFFIYTSGVSASSLVQAVIKSNSQTPNA